MCGAQRFSMANVKACWEKRKEKEEKQKDIKQKEWQSIKRGGKSSDTGKLKIRGGLNLLDNSQ